jgi:hypothetical protein
MTCYKVAVQSHLSGQHPHVVEVVLNIVLTVVLAGLAAIYACKPLVSSAHAMRTGAQHSKPCHNQATAQSV